MIARGQAGQAGQGGQASVELIAWLPAALIAAIVCWHLLAAGYLRTLVDGAAEAGALAISAGAPAEASALAALPGWSRSAVEIEVRTGGRVTVSASPPSPFPPLAEALEVTSTAWSRPHAADG